MTSTHSKQLFWAALCISRVKSLTDFESSFSVVVDIPNSKKKRNVKELVLKMNYDCLGFISFHTILPRKANGNIVSLIDPKQRYIATSVLRMSKDKMNKDERSIFLGGRLNWLLPIWTLPLVYEIRDKTQVVYKELARDEVQSKVAKSAFDL